jgi:DMSO/TMAO reductase YedYZ molybdopterin-dependent catalytic subunit
MDETDRPPEAEEPAPPAGEPAAPPPEAPANEGEKAGEPAIAAPEAPGPSLPLADGRDEGSAGRTTQPAETRAEDSPAGTTQCPAPPRHRPSLADRLREPEETPAEVPASKLRSRSRRDFLLFGAGTLAAAAGFWWLLPDGTRAKHLTPGLRHWLDSLEARLGATGERRERFLNRALTFDDDVAEALYSPDRSVRTYSRSQVDPLRNNYNGQTPSPGYIPGWTLAVSGLASGREERLTISDLLGRFPHQDQVTRLCCVEGWSMVAWWGGLRFADFLRAYPPAPGARWVRLDSAVNLDGRGKPDPYYVSIDLPTARHPQTLLATHVSGRPLPVEHGAPLRLLAPMKLGLKNIKAITSITYSAEQPRDYWNERGYSKYDGL